MTPSKGNPVTSSGAPSREAASAFIRVKSLRIGGVEPLTTVDFPGRLAAVVFCQGCPWRCPYCHNPALQPYGKGTIGWEDVVGFLDQRRGFLDGVVFSGGEPTMQPGLDDAVREVRDMGFAVGLHTAGMNPSALAVLLPRLDWVGFDVKAPLGPVYDALTGRAGSVERVKRSLVLLRDSGVPFVLRTTLDRDWLGPVEEAGIVDDLAGLGLPPPVWQVCRKPM
ncbi:MAG: anaerobic ribonucleoside-triphosphate reductase activating protein [Terrimicrobiaceae bacterium]